MSDGAWMGADEGEAAYMEAQAEQAYAEDQAQQALEAEAAYAEQMASQPGRGPVDDALDRHRSEADYIDRTIATVRNHREADNCWPQWANIFADEIEDLRADVQRLRDQVKFCPYCAGAFVPESLTYEGPCEGCKIAERLREERDEYAERLAWHREERDAYLKGNLWVTRAAEEQSRAEAAEAEVQRLTEGLREIESILKRKRDREGTGPYRALTVARETLEGDPERHVRALLSAGPSDGGGAK